MKNSRLIFLFLVSINSNGGVYPFISTCNLTTKNKNTIWFVQRSLVSDICLLYVLLKGKLDTKSVYYKNGLLHYERFRGTHTLQLSL